MKMTLCAACAKKLDGKKPENSKKDKCQCCGKVRWCTRWDVEVQ